jgi:effector-binding domain-containing protein
MPVQGKQIITKNIGPIRFLYFAARTTVAELSGLVGHVQQELFAEAVKHKFFISGPAYWNYFNFHDVKKPFDLQISVPVAKIVSGYKGKYPIKTTGPFRCVSFMHEGSWEKFPESYGLMMGFIHKQKMCLTSESREIYINVDFENHGANVTEIQIGIE